MKHSIREACIRASLFSLFLFLCGLFPATPASARAVQPDDEEPAFSQDAAAVTVKADIRKLFRKNTDLYWPYGWNLRFYADFTSEHGIPDSTTRRAEGSLMAANQLYFGRPSDAHAKGIFHYPVEFTTPDDTTRLYTVMDYTAGAALRQFCFTLARIRNVTAYNVQYERYKPKYNYLGKHDGLTTYKLTFADTVGYKNFVVVDVCDSTKEITRIDQTIDIDDGNGHRRDSRLVADCFVFRTRGKKDNDKGMPWMPIMVVSGLTYSENYSGGYVNEITMSNGSTKVMNDMPERHKDIKQYNDEKTTSDDAPSQ